MKHKTEKELALQERERATRCLPTRMGELTQIQESETIETEEQEVLAAMAVNFTLGGIYVYLAEEQERDQASQT